MNQPSGLRNMLRAAAGALPVVSRSDQLPNRTVTVEELPIDHTNVAEYAAVTGLRYGNNVPLTYPFALTFPAHDVAGDRFRLSFRRNGIGAHREPHHAVPADRGHRHRRCAGACREPARAPQGPAGRPGDRRQRRQRDRLAPGDDLPAPAAHQLVRRTQAAATEAAQASSAAAPCCGSPPARSGATPSSAAITTRSTPTRSPPSCSDSRPSSRTECSAAAAVLANIEAQFPDAVTYSVRFGKPVLLPATTGLYIDDGDGCGRLGSLVTQHRQGIPAPDRYGPRALARVRWAAAHDKHFQTVCAARGQQENQEQPDRRPGEFPDEDRRPDR